MSMTDPMIRAYVKAVIHTGYRYQLDTLTDDELAYMALLAPKPSVSYDDWRKALGGEHHDQKDEKHLSEMTSEEMAELSQEEIEAINAKAIAESSKQFGA